MTNKTPKVFLMAVHGAISLGKPLPIRTGAISGPIIPLAEVHPDSIEAQLQCFSIKTFASITGFSESTIKREIKEGRLKAIKRRRRKVITHEAAMAYLSSLLPDDVQFSPDANSNGTNQTHGE